MWMLELLNLRDGQIRFIILGGGDVIDRELSRWVGSAAFEEFMLTETKSRGILFILGPSSPHLFSEPIQIMLG